MRRAECVGMTVDDVDLDQRMVWVLGKGHRPRALPLGRKTAQALDRICGYARASTCVLAEPLGRAQWTHDSLRRLPSRPRPGPGRGASGDASPPAPARFRHQLAGGGRQ
jgi:integrase